MKKVLLIGFFLLVLSACNLPASTRADETPLTQTPLTTPGTAATSQAIAPTETIVPSPTPEPFPLFFTDEFDTESSYWEFLQTGGASAPTTTVQNGTLRIDLSSPDTWLIGIHNANTYENVFVHTTATVSPTGAVGLICRYSEDGWYEFDAASDGNYSLLLGQWLSEGVVKYVPIVTDVSNKLTETTTNEVGIFCQDNFVQLYVNDTMINRVEVTNYGLAEGHIGISAASLKDAATSVIFEKIQSSAE